MKIRRKGMQDGRYFFTAKIRKGHEAEDIAKIAKFQESTKGKQRYKILLDGDFSEREAAEVAQLMIAFNRYKNEQVRKTNSVNYSSAYLSVK